MTSTMELPGRSAIVTGGAGGLGGATVRHLVGLGVGVAVFDRDSARTGNWRRSSAIVPSLCAATSMTTTTSPQRSAPAAVVGALSIVVNVAGGDIGRRRAPSGRDGSPHDMQAFTETIAKNTLGHSMSHGSPPPPWP